MAEKANNSHPSKRDNAWWNNRFYIVLIAVALIGGGCAFFIPPFITSYGSGDSLPILRQTILAATGGVLAILTLWENRRKNDQEHTRQVHAERRARYAKAIEQLADDKSAIRLGGVYTLAKLVDDWLDDEKTLPSMEKRRQEGQIIIDSLCAYIRSSFPLAERYDELILSYEEYKQKCQDNKRSNQSREEFIRDKSLFREEQEVRQTILSEIKKRLNSGEVKRDDGKYEIKPGTWSYFEYNFLNTVFFYRVGFSNSYFGASLKFFEAEFTGVADFSRVKFTGVADFFRAEFTDANFYEAKFTEIADFTGAEFTDANFYEAKFTEIADFTGAEFTESADFTGAEFTESADFTGAEFTEIADFYEAKFTESADFTGVKFTDANFFRAKFTQNAEFSWTEFTGNADFSEATFTESANFSGAAFKEKPKFEYALDNKTYKAKFSHKVNPENYRFEFSYDSTYKIETEEQEYNGVKFIIPKGTELFDPDDPSS